MLDFFEFALPVRVVFGWGMLDKAGKYIKPHGKRALIVTGKSSAKHGYLTRLTAQLDELKIAHTVFDGVTPNPKSTEVDAAAKIAVENKCDLIIALGGGSIMDAAKGVAAVAKNGGGIWDYVYKGPGQKIKTINSALPLIVIPTMAATGSELNCGAVISNPATQEKTPFFADAVYPKAALIDPQLTVSLPYANTVDGGIDIICHVLEMYLSTDADDYLQDQLALAVTKTVIRALDILKNDLSNKEARTQLFWAASLALSGVVNEGRSGEFPMHSIEHVLSAHNDSLAHGRGLAAILLQKIRSIEKILPAKYRELGELLGSTAFTGQRSLSGVEASGGAYILWQKWLAAHQTGGGLGEYLRGLDTERLAGQVLRFSGTPDFLPDIKPLYKKDLIEFIEMLR
ncbi:MAG: iron-containing alcohol dehydrogenase [Candidatus Margulisbacteria bacterium]|jgi:alcohol dehydrogenase YqhD (iron-dependent ADH family)|nr:iron-containing alcohol dehydrogenase [Candidatus Margulisiibacteriota bacterium]